MDEFASHTKINWNGGHVGVVEYGGGDPSMIAMFYNRPVQNPQKSLDAGRPIFEDRIFVKIHPPGERLNIVDKPATESEKRRFPIQWNQFIQNQEQIPEGTPIDLLYPDQPSVAATLRAYSVHTVEQCAKLSGHAIETIGMGAQRYVNDAQKYLDAANKGVGAAQLRKELEDRDSKIRSLEHQIDMLKTQVQKATENTTAGLDPAVVQNLLSMLQGGARPQFPAGQPSQAFDAQTAQINAVHKTSDLTTTRKRPRKRLDD